MGRAASAVHAPKFPLENVTGQIEAVALKDAYSIAYVRGVELLNLRANTDETGYTVAI